MTQTDGRREAEAGEVMNECTTDASTTEEAMTGTGQQCGPRVRRTRARAAHLTKTLLVLFFCAGIAFLGLLQGGEHRAANARLERDPMDDYYGEHMPRYPDVTELPAGPESRLGGTRVRMSYFATKDEPAKVARFYEGFWRSRRFFVRRDVTHLGGVVSAVDPETQVIYQALITRRGSSTDVFPSVTTEPLAVADAEADPPPVELFPESRAVSAMTTEEGQTRARIHLSINEGGLEANLTHYQAALQAAGFQPETTEQPEELPKDMRVLLYRGQGREITVNLKALDDKQVRVHLMEVKE
jgi:hypothetical protein